ncbi:MAG: RNA polymerase sigma factor [Planctomycetaceae bacterium]|nr:RNA polymerase sigma factor [Planctomycetaceae bacterium]
MKRPTEEDIAAWYPSLFYSALRLTRCPEDAADVTQQAFLRGLENWEQFDGRSKPVTWLFSILLNCVRDWARRNKHHRQAQPLDEWAMPRDLQDDPAAQVTRRESAAAALEAIGELDAPVRAAFVVTVVDGYSYGEAAEILDVPLGTISSRVHQARTHLAGFVRDHKGEA